MMRAEVIWVHQFEGGISFEASATGSLGVTDTQRRVALAGDTATDGRTNPIGLISARARVTAPLPLDLSLTVQARAQYSALGPLPLSEQFQLFRAAEATAYDPETDQDDSGATVRAELGRKFAWPWAPGGAFMTPYVFGGGGILYSTSTSESSRMVVGSTWGIGSRLTLPAGEWLASALNFGVELYRQASSGAVPNYSGLTLNVSTKF